jgi:hypothetical protein
MSTLARGGTSHSVLITDIPCVDGLGAKEPSRSGSKDEPSGYKEERLVSVVFVFETMRQAYFGLDGHCGDQIQQAWALHCMQHVGHRHFLV